MAIPIQRKNFADPITFNEFKNELLKDIQEISDLCLPFFTAQITKTSPSKESIQVFFFNYSKTLYKWYAMCGNISPSTLFEEKKIDKIKQKLNIDISKITKVSLSTINPPPSSNTSSSNTYPSAIDVFSKFKCFEPDGDLLKPNYLTKYIDLINETEKDVEKRNKELKEKAEAFTESMQAVSSDGTCAIQ